MVQITVLLQLHCARNIFVFPNACHFVPTHAKNEMTEEPHNPFTFIFSVSRVAAEPILVHRDPDGKL